VPETPGTDQPPRADADPLPPLPSPPPLPPNDEEHQQ